MDNLHQLDNYRLLQCIGRGGAGSVFLAEERSTGDRRALKIMQAENPGIAHLLMREFHFLAQLQHENIVHIYNYATSGSVVYFVMEYIKGSDLLKYLNQYSVFEKTLVKQDGFEEKKTGADISVSEWMGPILEWLLQLCLPLGYLHGKGIVHCDLKPENVLITSDRKLKLVDFGIAVHSLKPVSMQKIRGTPAYIAPEQIKGGSLDPRTDIYSMGAVMFRLFTGRYVFPGDNPVQMLLAHVNSPPTDPCELNPDIPRFIGTMIMKCLSKNPAERYQSIEELQEALILALPDLGRSIPPVSRRDTGGKLNLHLFEPGVQGRGKEIRMLDQIGTGCIENKTPTGIRVEADPGMGKTSLVKFWLRELSADTWNKLYIPVENYPGNDIGLFREIAQWASSVARNQETASEPGLLEMIDELERSQDPETRIESDGKTSSGMKTLIYQMVKILHEISRIKPLALVLDDLDLSGPWPVRMIAQLIQMTPGSSVPVCIVMTMTPLWHNEWEIDTAIRNRLQMLRVVEPGLLTSDQTHDVLNSMIGLRHLPLLLVRHTYQETSGHPAAIRELIGTLIETGSLTRDPRGNWMLNIQETRIPEQSTGQIPQLMDRLIEQKFRRISPVSRRVASSLSVLRKPFSFQIITEILNAGSDDIMTSMNELVNTRVLIDSEPGTYAYIDQYTRRYAYRQLDETETIRLHDRAAAILVARNTQDFAEIAWHLEKSGRSELASSHYYSSGYQSWRRDFLVSQALKSIERGLQLKSSLPSQEFNDADLEALQFSGFLLYRLGRIQEAEDILSDSLRRTMELNSPLWECWTRLRLAEVYENTGRLDEAMQICLQGLSTRRRIADDDAGRKITASFVTHIGTNYHFRNQFSKALTAFRKALRISMGRNEKREIYRAMTTLGNASYSMSRYEDAERYWKQALQMTIETRQLEDEAMLSANLGILYSNAKQYKEALDHTERAVELFRQSGNLRGLSGMMGNLGDIQMFHGSYFRAKIYLQEAIRLAEDTKAPFFLTDHLLSLVCVNLLAGDYDAAKQLISRLKESLSKDSRIEKHNYTLQLDALHQSLTGHFDWLAIDRDRLNDSIRETASTLTITLPLAAASIMMAHGILFDAILENSQDERWIILYSSLLFQGCIQNLTPDINPLLKRILTILRDQRPALPAARGVAACIDWFLDPNNRIPDNLVPDTPCDGWPLEIFLSAHYWIAWITDCMEEKASHLARVIEHSERTGSCTWLLKAYRDLAELETRYGNRKKARLLRNRAIEKAQQIIQDNVKTIWLFQENSDVMQILRGDSDYS